MGESSSLCSVIKTKTGHRVAEHFKVSMSRTRVAVDKTEAEKRFPPRASGCLRDDARNCKASATH